MQAILTFLLLWGCDPTRDVRVNPELGTPGYYHRVGDYVEVRPGVPDTVLVHELAHSCGASEAEAHRLELLWREWQ